MAQLSPGGPLAHSPITTLCSYLSNVYASPAPPLLWKLNVISQVAETEPFFIAPQSANGKCWPTVYKASWSVGYYLSSGAWLTSGDTSRPGPARSAPHEGCLSVHLACPGSGVGGGVLSPQHIMEMCCTLTSHQETAPCRCARQPPGASVRPQAAAHAWASAVLGLWCSHSQESRLFFSRGENNCLICSVHWTPRVCFSDTIFQAAQTVVKKKNLSTGSTWSCQQVHEPLAPGRKSGVWESLNTLE